MKLSAIALAVSMTLAMSAANAGTFVNLTNGNGTNVNAANGGLVNGNSNQNADKLFLETLTASYLAGYEQTSSTGDVVATSINYRAFITGTTTNYTGTLTLLDWAVTRNVELADGNPQADIYDFVFRDSNDDKLVFGTRYLNRLDNNEEANFLYRYGFSGFSTSSAWMFMTDNDLRQYQAAKTSSTSTATTLPVDTDSVRQRSDVSFSEGNPWSGLFLVKTNAAYYTYGDKAIGYFQAGEEGQAKVGGSIAGFVASATLPVPEPETYGMMLLGLGLVAGVARRKQST